MTGGQLVNSFSVAVQGPLPARAARADPNRDQLCPRRPFRQKSVGTPAIPLRDADFNLRFIGNGTKRLRNGKVP
jgi:hypothetical protein